MKHLKKMILTMCLCVNYLNANAFVECRGGLAYNCSVYDGYKSCCRWPEWDYMCQSKTSEREYLKNDRASEILKDMFPDEYQKYLIKEGILNLGESFTPEEMNEAIDNALNDSLKQREKYLITQYGSYDKIPPDEYQKLRLEQAMANLNSIEETENMQRAINDALKDAIKQREKYLINKYGGEENIPADEYQKLQLTKALINSQDVLESGQLENIVNNAYMQSLQHAKELLIKKYGSEENIPKDELAKIRETEKMLNSPIIQKTK
ncbi:hypothetical protein [Nautilia lithotrophica]